MTRPYRIVVFGATGFTGKLTAQYLATTVPADFRWAIAGRTKAKLEQVKKEILETSPKADFDILIADSSEPQTLHEVTSSTDVILSTVGPFIIHGTPLVASCVKNGTDYVDSTGESHWIRKLIIDYHEEAKQKGVAIVNSCGFDSIPSDLGSLFVAENMKRIHSTRCSKIMHYITEMKAGASGGTLSTICTAFETGAFTKENMSPYSLEDVNNFEKVSKKENVTHNNGREQFGIKFDQHRLRWTGFFLMGPGNGKIVRRSNSLLSYTYGPQLVYSEVMEYNSIFVAVFSTIALFVFSFFLIPSITRTLIKKLLPAPGTGPSKEQLQTGYLKSTFIGFGENDPNKKVTAVLTIPKDPGYAFTAVMLAESALCLALQRNEVNQQWRQRKEENEPNVIGGVITPAACMGNLLLNRLTHAGLKINVTSA